MFRPQMVAIVRLYTLKLVNYYNMQIQFDVEISNTITFIGCYGVRDFDIKLYLRIVLVCCKITTIASYKDNCVYDCFPHSFSTL
jgi:hypothetical protein